MDVTLVVFHDPPNERDPQLTRVLSTVRDRLVGEHERRFTSAGVTRVLRLAGRATAAGTATFGGYLASVVTAERLEGGVVVMGSGAVPRLATRDARRLVELAGGGRAAALTNNRYSSDVIAVGRASTLSRLPPLPSDNALPRWLEEHAGYEVRDLAARDRLALDLDSPLDIALWAMAPDAPAWARSTVARERITIPRVDELRALARDPRRELLVFGRAGSRTLAWLERNVRCRVRFLAEERGLRASSVLAIGDATETDRADTDSAEAGRPPRATLGRLLAERGPAELATVVGELADGAIIDSRVLIADRLGADEAAWPPAEDRYASDLGDADAVTDPWLAALTRSAAEAALPIALGGHSLVGPGIPLLLAAAARRRGSAGTRR